MFDFSSRWQLLISCLRPSSPTSRLSRVTRFYTVAPSSTSTNCRVTPRLTEARLILSQLFDVDFNYCFT